MADLEDAAQLGYGQLQVLVYHISEGGRSANKFRKLQTQMCVLKDFVGFAYLPQMWHCRDLIFVYMICKRESFASLHINKKKLFLFTNIVNEYNELLQICTIL
jgi:hypothetical protein